VIYALAVTLLSQSGKLYNTAVHLYSADPQALMDNFHAAFSRDEVLSRGKWIEQSPSWFNEGVVTRDTWGDTNKWALVVYPLHDIEATIEGEKE